MKNNNIIDFYTITKKVFLKKRHLLDEASAATHLVFINGNRKQRRAVLNDLRLKEYAVGKFLEYWFIYSWESQHISLWILFCEIFEHLLVVGRFFTEREMTAKLLFVIRVIVYITNLRKPRSVNRYFRVKSEFLDKIRISKSEI